MIIRTAAAIVVCGLAVTQLVIPSVAAPNGHANEHAQANDGGGNGESKGNSGDHGGGNGAGSTVRQNVAATGAKQGDVASLLKSWNALNANRKAFANNLDNPNSLLGKQAAYICASAAAKAAEANFTSLVPSGEPPTSDQVAAAQAYVDAEALLGTLNPADVLADTASYSQAQVDAATLISTSTLTAKDAQATLDAQQAWTDYQKAIQVAGADFVAASVSYKNSADLSALRVQVDAVIALKNLDTTELCTTSLTASAQ